MNSLSESDYGKVLFITVHNARVSGTANYTFTGCKGTPFSLSADEAKNLTLTVPFYLTGGTINKVVID